MKRFLRWGLCAAAVLAFGLAGCGESGGDVGTGVPKNPTVGPPTAPPGSPSVSVDMSNTGIKPKREGEPPATK